MNLTEAYIQRMKRLSGIRLDEIELRATNGRSPEGTLSFYVEEYILNVGERILNSLDPKIKETQVMDLSIGSGTVKISQNSLLIPFRIEDKSNPKNVSATDYSLSISVNLEGASNTVASLKYGTLNDEFNLQSKHSTKDVDDFIGEIVKRVINVQKIAG